VVIDKLPFPPPHDPLVQARSKELESRGRDPFNDYYLSEAAIALKQGAGRLIRSETDLGLLVITDPRLRQMPTAASCAPPCRRWARWTPRPMPWPGWIRSRPSTPRRDHQNCHQARSGTRTPFLM
jgi:hypothetical protein